MTNFLKSTTLALTLLFASYVVSAGEVRVRAANKADVTVSYSLPSTQLSLREPFVITFQINNESTQVVSVDLGQDRKAGFLFTVTSPDGTTLRVPQYRHEGISQYGNVSVRPGEAFSQRLVLNEWYDNFKVPGKYKLKARLATPLLVGEAQLRDTEFEGEVSITLRDPVRLEKVCADLAKQVETASSVEEAHFPALALSFVEDPIAVPYLAQVMRARAFAHDPAIAGLERIGNDAAIETLLSGLDENYGGIAESAAGALARMQDRIADPRLKDTVQKSVERSKARARNEFIKTQIAYLGYRDPQLQGTAIQNLVQVEGGLQQAEPILQRLVNDPNQPADVRAAAKDALQRLHPNK